MADLSDEEKAKLVLGDEVESPADETSTEPEAPNDDDKDDIVEEAETETEESPEESEAEPTTFTKQFPNLKGATPDEYAKELENAYQNSFTEALRLKKLYDDDHALVEEAKRIIAGGQSAPEAPDTQTPSRLELDAIPEIQYAKTLMNQQMFSAFDEFKKQYPQATEPEQFDKFQKASNGVSLAFQASEGRIPTYPELFKGIAGTLGWQSVPDTSRKDAAIKDATSSSRTVSATVPAPKRSKVTDDEAQVYMRMRNVSLEQAHKDLAEVK